MRWELCVISENPNDKWNAHRRYSIQSRGDWSLLSQNDFLESSGMAVPVSGSHSDSPGLGRNQQFQCTLCPEVFLQTSQLKHHLAFAHGQELPFSCSICGKGYLTQSGLNHHIRAHKGKQFMCPVCGSMYTHKFHIKSHLRTKHRSAQCVICLSVLPLGPEYDSHVLQCK